MSGLSRFIIPSRQIFILYILCIYVALGVFYSTIIPLGEAPDEAPHFTVVRYILREGSLPVGPEEHEGFQPPLYYLLGALTTFWIDTDGFYIKANADFSLTNEAAPKNLLLHTTAESFPYRGWALAWHLIRLLSIAMGAVTVWATYRLARMAIPEHQEIAWGAASFTAFTPGFIFISSIVNNDNLATMLSSLILLKITMILMDSRRASVRDFLLLGLLLGFGVLAKSSLMVFALAILATAWIVAHRQSPNLSNTIGPGMLLSLSTLLLGFAVSGWWFLRNRSLYGDPLGWGLILKANALREGPLSWADWLHVWTGLYRSHWLAWIGIELDQAVYLVLGLVVLIAVAGFLRLLISCQQLSSKTAVLLLVLGGHTGLVVVSHMRWTTVVQGTGQARLLYPALSALVFFFFLGLMQWWPRQRYTLLAGLVGSGMFLLALIAPFRYIMPTYAPPPILTLADLPASYNPLYLDFDGKIRLVGYELNARRTQAGGNLRLDLYWQALRDLDQDYWLLIQLLDQEGQFLMYKDGCPSGGRYTTDFWRSGNVIPSRHFLEIPTYAQAGLYSLELRIHPFGRNDGLPIFDRDGEFWGDQISVAEIEIAGASAGASPLLRSG